MTLDKFKNALETRLRDNNLDKYHPLMGKITALILKILYIALPLICKYIKEYNECDHYIVKYRVWYIYYHKDPIHNFRDYIVMNDTHENKDIYKNMVQEEVNKKHKTRIVKNICDVEIASITKEKL